MSRDLLFRIFFPMLMLIIIFSALHFWTKGSDFFLNLVAEVIGIIITAFYINYILKRHEERSKRMLWKETEKAINLKLQYFIERFINYIIALYDLDVEFIEKYKWLDNNHGIGTPFFKNITQQFVEFSKEVLEKEDVKKIQLLTRKDWQEFIERMKGFLDSVSKMLIMFGDKLPPKQYALIMNIHEDLNFIIILYSLYSKEIEEIINIIDGLLKIVLIKIRELNDIIYAEKLE